MSEASELIAQQILNASVNKKNWGQVLYNVKVFGAQGDGIYDDTQAVQDAIDTAIFNDATLVYFPPGEYAVTDLSTTETINFVGDNAVFVGYSGVIVQLGSNSSDIVLNVKDFGAVGDGVADDTVAVKATISACPAGGTVFFPVPTLRYKLTEGLVINKSMALRGSNSSDNQNGGTRSTTILFQSSTDAISIQITVAGVTIEDLFIQNATTTTMQTGIQASTVNDIKLENLWLQNYITGVKMIDCIVSTISHVTVRDCTFGFRLDTAVSGGTSITLTNCWAQSVITSGVAFRIENYAYVTLINCAVDGAVGFEPNNGYRIISSSNVTLVGCGSEKISTSAIYIDTSEEISILNFFAYLCNLSATSASLAVLTGTTKNVTLMNCRDNTPSGTISVQRASGANVPIMIGCNLPNGYSDEGTLITVASDSIAVGLAALLNDGVIVKASDSATVRKKISVTAAGAISAATV